MRTHPSLNPRGIYLSSRRFVWMQLLTHTQKVLLIYVIEKLSTVGEYRPGGCPEELE